MCINVVISIGLKQKIAILRTNCILMNREILRLAIPNIISNLSVPLLSTVDTALMGHLSPLHLGAVGLGSMLFNVIYWNFGFLRMGTTGLTAQAFGRNDKGEMIATLLRALLISTFIAILLLLLHPILAKLGFQLMNVSAAQTEYVADYFFTRIWAVPATLGLYVVSGWFFGMQNALFPLYTTLFLNLLNIGLNFLLVRGFGMGVQGVALATVIAQYAGFLMALVLFWMHYKPFLADFNSKMLGSMQSFRRFLTVNRDIFLRTLLLTFVYGFFYSKASTFGELTLAANVLLLQLVFWVSYGIDGFAFAAESLVGKYAGATNQPQLKKAIQLSLRWGFGVALAYSLFFMVGREKLPAIFSNDLLLLKTTRVYYGWIIIIPIASYLSFIWDGILVGLTAAQTMRNSMLASAFAFILGFYLFESRFENHALWLALTLFLFFRGLIIIVLVKLKGQV